MRIADQKPSELHDPTGDFPPGRHNDAAWDALDRFACSLQARTETSSQIRLCLESVDESLEADAVYWDPGSTNDGVHCVGRIDLPSGLCREITARLIATDESRGEDGQILGLSPTALSPGSVSVAMVRVSRSLNSWIVAVSFTTGRQFVPADLKVISLARRLLLNHRQNLHMNAKLRESLLGLVRCLTAAIEAKDPYTSGHSERVARIGQRIGVEMGLSETELGDIYLAGLLHDIGKIGVRDDILLKPGVLTAEEKTHIQHHTIIGDRMISSVRQLDHLRPGVRNHHERFDGKGYPDGVAGERIPLLARVLAVADSCDAMMADRPYRAAMPTNQIEAILTEEAGRMWDPAIVKHFMACRRDLYQISQRGVGESMIAAINQAFEINANCASISVAGRR